jgi:predicted nucleic acid-binding protein
MATMAADPVFVDTNVLVYATRPSAAQHVAALTALTRLEGEGSALWVSPQVLREYLATVTRPQATAAGLTMATAIADVRNFRLPLMLPRSCRVALDRLLDLLAAHRGSGRQVHDTNIVATVIEHGIRRSLTFNAAALCSNHRYRVAPVSLANSSRSAPAST